MPRILFENNLEETAVSEKSREAPWQIGGEGNFHRLGFTKILETCERTLNYFCNKYTKTHRNMLFAFIMLIANEIDFALYVV